MAISYFIRDKKAGVYEISTKIAFTLMTAAMGTGAAALLIVADAIGKKSNMARWLTLIGLLLAIASIVLLRHNRLLSTFAICHIPGNRR